MNQKLALVLFAFAFIVAIVVGFGEKQDLRPAPAEFRAKFQETLLKPLRHADPALPSNPPARNPSSEHGDRRPAGAPPAEETGEPLTREAFVEKYGDRLRFEDYENRVIRVDGSGIPAEGFADTQKLDRFRPSDATEASARAREVFANARRLLGIPDEAEFIQHPPTTGEATAQSIFQQSENGIPLSPGGTVTILLGPDGEVRSIESSIYPKVEVANQASLERPEASREILYVTQSSPVAIVHHAYETRDRGVQKVVDAQTGAVLLERNRRVY
ncbi:MAG: hypothetical protein JST04_12470 [Bdellovibrionales bacterium]|nr:hypothetical protein [Bdellovibrionales bacterium]